jgi:hypothetical protein
MLATITKGKQSMHLLLFTKPMHAGCKPKNTLLNHKFCGVDARKADNREQARKMCRL